MKNFTIASLLLIVSSVAFAEGNPVAGKSKAIICIGCHGVDGNNSNPTYPKLAGQNVGYLIKQLKDFKKGDRKDEYMNSMVEVVNELDIPDIAAFFASQRRKKDAKGKIINMLGKQIFHAGIKEKNIPACASCHGFNGFGDPKVTIPVVADQHSEYVEKQLKAFRSGTRSNDPIDVMRKLATRLSDMEITSAVIYIANLNSSGLGESQKP